MDESMKAFRDYYMLTEQALAKLQMACQITREAADMLETAQETAYETLFGPQKDDGGA